MPQTDYSSDSPVIEPGVVYSSRNDTHIESCAALEVIPYGRGIEFNADRSGVQLTQGNAVTAPRLAGVSVAKRTREAGALSDGYQIGELVPFLRKGAIGVALGPAGTGTIQTAANVHCAGVTATNRGKFTSAATSAGADAGIADVGAKFRQDPGIAGVGVVTLNLT